MTPLSSRESLTDQIRFGMSDALSCVFSLGLAAALDGKDVPKPKLLFSSEPSGLPILKRSLDFYFGDQADISKFVEIESQTIGERPQRAGSDPDVILSLLDLSDAEQRNVRDKIAEHIHLIARRMSRSSVAFLVVDRPPPVQLTTPLSAFEDSLRTDAKYLGLLPHELGNQTILGAHERLVKSIAQMASGAARGAGVRLSAGIVARGFSVEMSSVPPPWTELPPPPEGVNAFALLNGCTWVGFEKRQIPSGHLQSSFQGLGMFILRNDAPESCFQAMAEMTEGECLAFEA